MPNGIRSRKAQSEPSRKRRHKPNQSSAPNSDDSARDVSSVQRAAKWSGVRFGGQDNQIAWDHFARAAIIGWLSRGVLGHNDDLASECAVFADLMMAERTKRFT